MAVATLRAMARGGIHDHLGGGFHRYDGRGTLPGTLPSNIRFEASGCVNCHRQIHGSNAPSSAYGDFFLR